MEKILHTSFNGMSRFTRHLRTYIIADDVTDRGAFIFPIDSKSVPLKSNVADPSSLSKRLLETEQKINETNAYGSMKILRWIRAPSSMKSSASKKSPRFNPYLLAKSLSISLTASSAFRCTCIIYATTTSREYCRINSCTKWIPRWFALTYTAVIRKN